MYIYRGKLDFRPRNSQNATNEGITIIFPSEFRLGDPVYTCWQWSTLGKMKNVPCWLTSIIGSVANSGTDGSKIGFHGSEYSFDGFLSGSKGIEKLSLTVRYGNVAGTAMNTKLVFRSNSRSTIDPGVIVPRIYLGKFTNYPPYSANQLLLVVIPGRTIGEGNPICAFWQWDMDRHGTRDVNVDFTTLKMANVEKVADHVSFRFTDGRGCFTFHATVSSKETDEQQQLTLVISTSHPSFTTGSLMLGLRDLRPFPSERHPRRVNDSATMVIDDTNKITSGSQNEESSLMSSLVEIGPKVVERMNKLNEKLNDLEQAVRDRDHRDGIIAQLESQLRVAQLESHLRAEQDENKLLKTMLLETSRVREKDQLTAQESKDTLRGGAKWKCLIRYK